MKKQLFFLMFPGLVFYSTILCMDPEKPIDLTGQANIEISPEQMAFLMQLEQIDVTAYKNIIQAHTDAVTSPEVSASFKNLVQTYTQQLAIRLNKDEKAIIAECIADIKSWTNFIKTEIPKINDASLDQATKDKLIAEFTNKMTEQGKYLGIKWFPFGLALKDFIQEQENKISPEDRDKNI